MSKVKEQVGSFFGAVGGFFKEFGTAVAKGDIFVKLSLLWMGAGYCKRKQFMKALLITAFEAAIIAFTFGFAMDYVPKFGTLGTVQQESVFNVVTMKNEFNDYDHSFMILLFSLISFVVWAISIVVYLNNIINAYKLQKMEEEGKHINTFKEDMLSFVNGKFHITLLALPVTGVVVLC